uniref:Calponin-homology (CH) domain-containing protein n=1 Tax=Cyclopterus lumpus TaxID=8103 RepID=A0A8C2X979_CYCLU
MSDILCRWLNEELRLSKAVDPKTFARDFSSGYLIGEVLHKYQLQNDFSMFMKKDTSISRLSNFTRVEPTLRLLGISFDINAAQELMQEKQGVATRLLYQLYISLEKKKKAEISGTLMEIMQPAANFGPHKKEHEIYSDLHWNKEPLLLMTGELVMLQLRVCRQKQNDIRTFNQATIVQVPKPPPYTSQLHLKRRQQQHGQPPSGDFPRGGLSQGFEVPGSGAKLTLQSNSKYLQDIQQRLEEKAVAREQKDKRQNRFLVEQLKAQEAQEEAQREEQLVKRLTRQTQQEQRLASQLLQVRVQKDVVRKNRLFREQQYQQRRERDFQEALEREAALAQQAKLDRAEEIRKELEFCNRIAAERAQGRFKKHRQTCKDILEQIVDLATKVGEYRLHTGNLIPEKPMREWKELLFSGLPLYESVKCQQPGFGFSAPLDPVELKKQEILKNQDYEDYTNMVGEWAWPEEARETKLPLTNNNILGHVVLRLRNIVHPPIVEPSPPSFPHFTIKACVLGKFCSGKTTCLAKLTPGTRHAIETQMQRTRKHHFLSIRAMQGAAAEKVVREGNAIPNELLVDIMLEAIRQVPAQSGWILDGFPVDITQVYVLEKALGGSVDGGDGVVSSRTELAADPHPPKPTPPPPPALDLALLLDVPDECVIRRAFSQPGTLYYCELSGTCLCSPQTLCTLLRIRTQVTSHMITAFQDTWPKLEKWFGERQNILVRVDADVDEEELHKRVESVLGKAPDSSCSATPPPVDQAHAESYISIDEEKAQSVKSLSKSNTHSPQGGFISSLWITIFKLYLQMMNMMCLQHVFTLANQ